MTNPGVLQYPKVQFPGFSSWDRGWNMDEFRMKIGKLRAEMGIFVGSRPGRLGNSQECGKLHIPLPGLWQRREGGWGEQMAEKEEKCTFQEAQLQTQSTALALPLPTSENDRFAY